MFIRAIGHYVPENRLASSYFARLNGQTEAWMYTRTGVKTRTRAENGENTNTMGVLAVKSLQKHDMLSLTNVDLIVGATYTPFDTVFTLGHAIQRAFSLSGAKVLSVSSACSSLLNALEVVEGYFAMGKASKALVVVSEHNSAYSHDEDLKSGHLWGDGAAALLITKDEQDVSLARVLSIYTKGAATKGKSDVAVSLRPRNGGLQMPEGKDVFVHAVKYMQEGICRLLAEQQLDISGLHYLIPHQANMRISKQLASNLHFPIERVLSTIEDFGNTGAAGALITFSKFFEQFKANDVIGFTVFGGGYSMGSMLIQWLDIRS